MENALRFAYCNMAGVEGEIAYWGGSRILAPGNCETKVPGDPVVVQALYDEEALVCGTVDYAWTERFRPFFPVLRDLRAEMYQQLTEVVHTSME